MVAYMGSHALQVLTWGNKWKGSQKQRPCFSLRLVFHTCIYPQLLFSSNISGMAIAEEMRRCNRQPKLFLYSLESSALFFYGSRRSLEKRLSHKCKRGQIWQKSDQEDSVVNVTRAFVYEKGATLIGTNSEESHTALAVRTARPYIAAAAYRKHLGWDWENCLCPWDTTSPLPELPQTKDRHPSLWPSAAGIASLFALKKPLTVKADTTMQKFLREQDCVLKVIKMRFSRRWLPPKLQNPLYLLSPDKTW